jgi:hypothetical protein
MDSGFPGISRLSAGRTASLKHYDDLLMGTSAIKENNGNQYHNIREHADLKKPACYQVKYYHGIMYAHLRV